MSSIKLQADTGKYIVAHVDNGQNGIWAISNSENDALSLEFSKVGGHDQANPLRIQFKRGTEYVTLHGDTLVLDASGGTAAFRNFEVLWLGKDKVALKAVNGLFVSRETDGQQKLRANRPAIGPWEIFTII